jgi:large subunit ribosomal protein L28
VPRAQFRGPRPHGRRVRGEPRPQGRRVANPIARSFIPHPPPLRAGFAELACRDRHRPYISCSDSVYGPADYRGIHEITAMAKTCIFTGKKAVFGNRKKYRGKAKYLGGVGKKILGTSRRKFKPNLQKVTCVIDGVVKKVWVSASAIRSGLVVKPVIVQPFEKVNV